MCRGARTRVTSGSSAFLSCFAIDGRSFDGLCIVLSGPEQDLNRLPWLRRSGITQIVTLRPLEDVAALVANLI